MAEFYLGHLPDVLYHGTHDPFEVGMPVKPGKDCGWWYELDWDEYAEGEEGLHRTAYPNIIWEYLGLCGLDRSNVPDWAKDLANFDDLGTRIGMLFVTDRPTDAERYGPAYVIDMTSPSILDVVVDPNAGTHNAWILVLEAGKPIPILQDPSPAPRT